MSIGSSTLSLGGLASGLDTNTIITQLMSIERRPQVHLQEQQLIERSRQTTLGDVKTRLNNLSTAIAALRDPSTWADVQTVESSDAAKVVATRVAGAAAGAYEINVTKLARADQLAQTTGRTTASADGTLTFQVGAGSVFSVNVTSGDSLDTVASRINGTSSIPVYATVSGGKLYISGKSTGAANTITAGGTLAADFGFTQSIAAQDAEYTVNGGAAKTSASNTVTDGIPGVTLTLKTQTAAPVTVVVGGAEPDSDAIQTKVQAFVDQYNSTIDFIRGKLNEEQVANPQSTSDKLKGLLRGDPGLSALLSNLRQSVADVVSGHAAGTSYLSDVGVSTGATTGSGALDKDAIAGKLTFDATKLTAKLSSSFDEVKGLFTNVTGVYGTEGLSQRLDAALNPWVKGDGTNGALIDSRIATSQTLVSALAQQSIDFDERMKQREAALRAKFTAMETALAQSQSLQSQLASQIASL